ncbi:hypothetical protein F511_00429 [Dorcoceras hygrometricum]|uniref:Uncharacterized protein n=1 Tax=Dorcoceras hygrometricum TaxID=472368 RepID=A0A2Z7BC31_9LAMI|nr:hypothetical protein F511_00429 [Dorcoceras hygrometricum]
MRLQDFGIVWTHRFYSAFGYIYKESLTQSFIGVSVIDGAVNAESVSAVEAWNHSDFLCQNYVLNVLADALYNILCEKKTAKELWESLDRKYKTEDVGAKKFLVGRFLDFKMLDSKPHWKVIVRLLRYLRYTRDYGLHYSRYPAVIEGYSDANWISDMKYSKSTSGFVFTLGGAVFTWKSSKQTVIARSTMESEFIALDKCGEEAEWLRLFVEDISR